MATDGLQGEDVHLELDSLGDGESVESGEGGRNEITEPEKSGSLRLMNGSSPCAGRLEVYHRGQWGTVDGEVTWGMKAAAVVCKELGCGAALSASGDAHFGRGSGYVMTYVVECRGNESTLRECPSGNWSHYLLPHSYDAGVICSGGQPPRLVNGGSRCAGRLELYTNETWATLCGENLNTEIAVHVCKLLGCGFAVSATGDARFGEGSGSVVGRPDCGHGQDSSITCSDQIELRLVSGSHSCSGRVEMLFMGLWGTVCDDNWDLADADVVCSELGCGPPIAAVTSAMFGEGKGQIWLDDVACVGNESHLWRCPARTLSQHNCNHGEDAGVVCMDRLRKPTLSLKLDSRMFVRGEFA
ncbi:deleted in malignant brain tumors 1 protein-like, partial [Callorhinchus milii]|uniref:deleted in malignant brain tumors 1 protein-like n=1 Tax=Callorhinchus milii TaxID=7868 RepID=UPI001C3FAA01